MKRLNDMYSRMWALVLALVMMLVTVIPANVMAQAADAENANVAATATPGDSDGIYKADDGNYYYYIGGKIVKKAGCISDGKGTTYVIETGGIVTTKLVKKGEIRNCYNYTGANWQLIKGKYKTIDGVLYYFDSKNGIAVKMYKNSTSQLYKYVSSKMQLVKNDVSTINSNRIYFFNSKGQKVTKAGWYTAASGTRVYVNKNGYVAVKLSASGKSKRYYSYDYKSLRWTAKKNTWVNINGVDYYFAKSGIAVYMHNTKTGRFVQYKNGKWNTVKNTMHTLKNGKIYLINSKSVVTKKAGWYGISGTDKVYVSSKGYVTMKFSTKSGKLNKYNYSKKKWELVKVTSYKIGKKTYYFDSKGVVAKNKIVGNKKTGYFYVDKTGCRVNQREIQMAVNFVMANTNSKMTTNQKMYRCFHILSEYPYMRDYVVPTDIRRFYDYAADTFTLKQANCYRYSAAFACVATVLGYEARVTCGEVPNIYDTGMTIHGWTELWSNTDKQWKVYDVRMHHNFPNRNYYNVYMRNYYPNRCVQGPRARLTVKNGKVNWRWLADSELGDH